MKCDFFVFCLKGTDGFDYLSTALFGTLATLKKENDIITSFHEFMAIRCSKEYEQKSHHYSTESQLCLLLSDSFDENFATDFICHVQSVG